MSSTFICLFGCFVELLSQLVMTYSRMCTLKSGRPSRQLRVQDGLTLDRVPPLQRCSPTPTGPHSGEVGRPPGTQRARLRDMGGNRRTRRKPMCMGRTCQPPPQWPQARIYCLSHQHYNKMMLNQMTSFEDLLCEDGIMSKRLRVEFQGKRKAVHFSRLCWWC